MTSIKPTGRSMHQYRWEHDYADPVDLLQPNCGVAGVPGPAEGSLFPDVPGWLAVTMREGGLALVGRLLVLTREVLSGPVPEPDGVDVLLAMASGSATGASPRLLTRSIGG